MPPDGCGGLLVPWFSLRGLLSAIVYLLTRILRLSLLTDMTFDLEAEVKRATAAYLSLEGIAIPESIRKREVVPVAQESLIPNVKGWRE